MPLGGYRGYISREIHPRRCRCTVCTTLGVVIVTLPCDGVCHVTVGMATQLAPLYLAEISPYNLRGMFGTANQLFITLGIFAGSVFGLGQILGKIRIQIISVIISSNMIN